VFSYETSYAYAVFTTIYDEPPLTVICFQENTCTECVELSVQLLHPIFQMMNLEKNMCCIYV